VSGPAVSIRAMSAKSWLAGSAGYVVGVVVGVAVAAVVMLACGAKSSDM